jgi:anaerobic selenocysteine-containing dehydrogenase
MMTTRYPRRESIDRISNPDKLLVVIDPRRSETAKIADIHLALRPGTDALLLKSMIAIILKEGMHNQEYIDKHVNGFKEILPWFAGFDVNAALKVCELDYDQVFRVCWEFAKRRSCLRDDLGILMNRHSALVSYLLVVLLAICGRIGVPGGDYLAGGKMYSDPNDPKTWRTADQHPAIAGMFLSQCHAGRDRNDRPDRLEGRLRPGSQSHCGLMPIRPRMKKAFGRLDLLVVTELQWSETASLAHHVLALQVDP